ncbi:uncharacterized protein TNCV_4499431 [Trichonephila clavipes]|nr:uncharacterized protein TNCV_4499431 [Trichonephila clavipes]
MESGTRLTINVDQVRIYRHKKCDETEIGTGSSRITVVCAMKQVVLTENNGDQMTREMRGRHNKEGQFDSEKAEKGTIVHTSRSEQDKATRMPDEEVINNGKIRKGEERVQRNPCHWRPCPTENSLAVLNHKILEANSQVQNGKLGGHQTCLSINRLWLELCDMLRRLVRTTAPGHHDCSIQE